MPAAIPAPTNPAAIGCWRTVSATVYPAFFTPAMAPPCDSCCWSCCSCFRPGPRACPAALPFCSCFPDSEPRPRELCPGCDFRCDSGRDCLPPEEPEDLDLDDSDRLFRCWVAIMLDLRQVI